MTRETIERGTQRAEQPQRHRHRADAPPARGPKSPATRRRAVLAVAAAYCAAVGAVVTALPWWGVWLTATPGLALGVVATVAGAAVTR